MTLFGGMNSSGRRWFVRGQIRVPTELH